MSTDPLLLIYRPLEERAAALLTDRDGYLARVHAERDVEAARAAAWRSPQPWPWLRRLLRRPCPFPARFYALAAYNGAGGRGYSDAEHEAMRTLQAEFDEGRWRR